MDARWKADGRQKQPGRQRSQFAANERLSRTEDSGILEGKNAVLEALKAGREIDKIWFATGSHKSNGGLIALARKQGVVVQECDRRKLDKMSTTGAHQGVVAQCAAASYVELDDILALAQSRGEKPVVVLCDGITDPHNLGAIIRTAEVVGAHGVVVPRRRSAGLNAACAKAAAGALEFLPVAKVANLQTAVEELKEKGLFLFAADMVGTVELYEADFTGGCGIVIGSEGEGVSRNVLQRCDFTVSIPQKGRISSLNASNAAAVLLYEVYRQRRG